MTVIIVQRRKPRNGQHYFLVNSWVDNSGVIHSENFTTTTPDGITATIDNHTGKPVYVRWKV